MTADRTYLSIGDVLTLLRQEFPDVTISKIRFLESQGLVNPERTPSGYRKFYDHDVDRLKWVLRQQREHFLPLKVIKGRLNEGPGSDPGPSRPRARSGTESGAVPDDGGSGRAGNGRRAGSASAGAASAGAGAGGRGAGQAARAVPAVQVAQVAQAAQAGRFPGFGESGPRAGEASPSVAASAGGQTPVASRGASAGVEHGRPAARGLHEAAQGPSAPSRPGASRVGGQAASGGSAGSGFGSGRHAHSAAGSGVRTGAGSEHPPAEDQRVVVSGGQQSAGEQSAGEQFAGQQSAGSRVLGESPPEASTGWHPSSGGRAVRGAAGRTVPAGAVAGAGAVAAAGPSFGVDPRPGSVRGATSTLGATTAGAADAGGAGSAGSAAPGISPRGSGAGTSQPGKQAQSRSPAEALALGHQAIALIGQASEPAGGSGPGAKLSTADLAAASGLSEDTISELHSYGILEGRVVGGVVHFDELELAIARLAAAFATFGIQPRHLRTYKHASDREAGFVEQLVLPLLKQRNPEARKRAAETISELTDLGQGLRAALVRRNLQDLLGG